VDQAEHLFIVGIGIFLDAIPLERLGVDPPLWSSAAMKPCPLAIFSVISAWFMIDPVVGAAARGASPTSVATGLPNLTTHTYARPRHKQARAALQHAPAKKFGSGFQRGDAGQFLAFHPFEKSAASG
jgi:hypothetical protein